MKKGFTLIELLVVVLIIGILAAVALPQYRKAVTKTRFVQIQTAFDSLVKQNELYFMANGTYATDFETFDIPANGCKLSHPHRFTCSWGGCTNWNNGGNISCSLTPRENKRFSLEYFPNSKRKDCVVEGPTTDSDGYRFCNSLPHTSITTGGCSVFCYRFWLS